FVTLGLTSTLIGSSALKARPVKLIYVDEAGRAENEPATIAAGVIVDPDAQFVPVEEELARIRRTVPERHRANFISHATAVWGNKKFREGWSFEDRLQFLIDMVSIPSKLGLPVSLAMVLRTNPNPYSSQLS